ncbi:MAG: toll/interleukin-1 receptor domain-containing protein [Rhizomicrobium sp.]
MAANTVDSNARYWAFISYSHRDAGFGRKLHQRLESYSLPRRLIGRQTVFGPAPKRPAPIFRDRDELPASSDLTAEVQAALNASRSLIVVCSPDAASSMWVRREVELFRELHPDRPILCALWRGDPSESVPGPLRHVGADGALIEPLAADFRSGGDGRQMGILKLVAGILGIRLDELIQRDSTRRVQRVTAITIGALTLMVFMLTLTIFALVSRADAQHQRSEAEGLVEFMLTDLRDRLKGVGRLDLMNAVNERALKYYSDQDLASLPIDSLERRARLFHAMGEDEETRGHYDSALKIFREAERTTAALLAASPNDPERIFTHAQTVFWIGSVQFLRHDFKSAKEFFLAYKRLTDRLVIIAPENVAYMREAGYADANLCSIALMSHRKDSEALPYCSSSLAHKLAAAHRLGLRNGIADDLIDGYAWMADAYFYSDDLLDAKKYRLQEEQILDAQIRADPRNMDLKDTWITMERALALIESDSGDKAAAAARLNRLLVVVQDMARFDPKNRSWAEERVLIERNLSSLH